MAEKFISLRNLQFLLYEHLDTAGLTKYPYFEDHSRETFDMVLETGMRMGKGILFPALAEMDKKPPEFRDGKVFVHPVAAFVVKSLDLVVLRWGVVIVVLYAAVLLLRSALGAEKTAPAAPATTN